MTINTGSITRKGNEKLKLQLSLVDRGAKLDLTGSTLLQIWVRKPGTAVSKQTATNVSTATESILQYLSAVGFIDTIGPWRYEAYVEFGAAGVDGKFHSEIAEFFVEDNLESSTL